MLKAFFVVAIFLLLSAAFGVNNNLSTAPPTSNLSDAKTDTPPVVQFELTVSGQMQLSWSAISSATGYMVYHANVPEPVAPEAWTILATLPPDTLFYLVNPDLAKDFFYVTSLVPAQGSFILVEGGTFNNGTSDA